MKKIKFIFIILLLVISMSNIVFAENNIDVFVNGEEILMESSPKIEEGRTLIPIREVAEALGASVSWNQNSKSILIANQEVKIELKIDRSYAMVDDDKVILDVPPKILDEKTFIPVRFVAENLNAQVDWIERTKTIAINDKMIVGKSKLDYATKFELEYLDHGNKIVKDSLGKVFLLVPYGNEIPKGYDEAKLIRTPVKNILAGSATQVSILDVLGKMSLVSGVTNPAETWTIADMKKSIESGIVKNVGNGMTINYESLEILKPEIIFLTSAWDDTSKYDELGYDYIACFDYLENKAFGRLESIKFWGAFVNQDKLAINYYKKQVKKLEKLETKLDGLKTRKKIAWGSYSSYSKAYSVASGTSYVREMIELAGGEYLGKNIKEKEKNISAEEYFILFKDADILVSSSMPQYGGPTSINQLITETPLLDDTAFVKNSRVWYQGPNFYQDLANTYDYIEDLAMMFYPEIFDKIDINHFEKMK